jgi:15-cis-phytoene synthase
MTRSGEADAHIARLVREGDRDRYWSALLAPEPSRRALLSVYAFDLELARISQIATESQIGMLRLKWWHEATANALAGQAAEHPVLAGLADAAVGHNLPAELLAGMVEAREAELSTEAFATFEELEAYLDATGGAVFRLGAMILDRSADLAGPARHAAIACGLTELMRALPRHTARGKLFLPQSLLAAHGLHPDTVRAAHDTEDVRAMLRDLRARAAAALSAFRRERIAISRTVRPAFLPVALTGAHLRELARSAHRPFVDLVQLNPLRRYFRFWRSYLTGRF